MQIIVAVWDANASGKQKRRGQFQLICQSLLRAHPEPEFDGWPDHMFEWSWRLVVPAKRGACGHARQGDLEN
ncbi:MAG TPA: hypothetical protein VJS85_02740 [Rhizomicrobium sp.]|nr:hypothetical protein [Rhizomicrobium sp.]